MRFGENLKELRKAAGLTQEKLAEEVSVSTEYISRIETGRFHPSFRLIERIAHQLQTTEQFLLFGSRQDQQINHRLFLQFNQLSPHKKEILLRIMELLEPEE